MRIGIDLISDTGKPSGVHTYSNRLVEAMLECIRRPDSEFHNSSLVVFQHDDFQWLFPIEDAPEVQIVRTGIRNAGAVRRRILQQTIMPGLARRAHVDIVHSLNNVMPLRLNVPGVLTVLDLSPFVIPERFGMVKRRFLRLAVPRSIRRASSVIAISQNTRTEILRRVRGVLPEKIHTIYLAADEAFGDGRDDDREARLSKRLGLPPSFLLYVGAAEPGKNLPGIARALELIKDRESLDIPWVLAGVSGGHLAALQRRWRDSAIAANVHVLGVLPVEEIRDLYRMARAFVFPSLYEGFGLPLLEAFSSGTPVITSGGDSALGEVAGNAAYQVDPEDPGDLASAIVKVWKYREIRELLRLRGTRRAADFDWTTTAGETLQVFKESYRNSPADVTEADRTARPSRRCTPSSSRSSSSARTVRCDEPGAASRSR